MRKFGVLLTLSMLAGLSVARADDLTPTPVFIDGEWVDMYDPATLHTGGGAGTSCATGCALDPNPIPSNHFDIYQTSGGAGLLGNPFLVIVGVPNDKTGNLFPTNPIGAVTSYNPYPTKYPSGGVAGLNTPFPTTPGQYGIKAAVSGDYYGNMTSGEAYAFLGLYHDTNSESFGNWAATDLSRYHITATNFGIYAFSVTTTLKGGGLIDFSLTKNLPTGSYVIGYGETPITTVITTDPKTHKKSSTKSFTVYDTAFTEGGSAAIVGSEPGTPILLGITCLLCVAWIIKRRSIISLGRIASFN
jgi:hypothetical protein